MKKMRFLILAVCAICLFSACKAAGPVSHWTATPSAATPLPQPSVMPLTITDKAAFRDRVLQEHSRYNETKELSEYQLAQIRYYYDFKSLPEGAEFTDVTVSEKSEYITLRYRLDGAAVALTWFRADFGAGYNHFERSKAETEGLPQKQVDSDGRKILEVFRQAGRDAGMDRYSYYWEQEGDYLDLNVEASLREKYGAEAFLAVEKVLIEFGETLPAEIPEPEPVPPTTEPVPPTAGPGEASEPVQPPTDTQKPQENAQKEEPASPDDAHGQGNPISAAPPMSQGESSAAAQMQVEKAGGSFESNSGNP